MASLVMPESVLGSEPAVDCSVCCDRGDGQSTARDASVPLINRLYQYCAVYTGDHFLASSDVIVMVLPGRLKSTYFAPLQPQSI